MRVSTNMITSAGVNTINQKTAEMLHLQQQVSSGRRLLTPADDPIAAARALEVTQAKQVTTQFSTNAGAAKSILGLEESQLATAGDLIGRIRELAVQGGNGSLTLQDRQSLAVEIRARFDELMGIANATDGTGQYMFSGYMGATKPFGGSIDFLNQAAANEVTYSGDAGQRSLQITASRQIETSDSGNDVFVRVPEGNGYFKTSFNAANTGSGVIDGGTVTNPATWNALIDKNYQIKFWVDNTTTPGHPQTYYDIVDTTNNLSMITGAAPAAPPTFPGSGLRLYNSGQPIILKTQAGDAGPAFDLGSQVMVTGDPGDGDNFDIGPAASHSLFKTIASLVDALENTRTLTAAGQAALANKIGFALTDLDQANDNLLRVRANIGSRLSEAESIANLSDDLSLQYQQTLSQLQDLDYAGSISDLARKQTDLEAAQKSYMSVSKLSLFNYL